MYDSATYCNQYATTSWPSYTVSWWYTTTSDDSGNSLLFDLLPDVDLPEELSEDAAWTLITMVDEKLREISKKSRDARTVAEKYVEELNKFLKSTPIEVLEQMLKP